MQSKESLVLWGSRVIFGFVFLFLSIFIFQKITNIYAVSNNVKQDEVCVPIIVYHQVKETDFGKDVISIYEFESDLKYLSENNYDTITMTELIDYVYNDGELPKKPIILTFDDGYLTSYEYVFPLLQKYNAKIVLSIIGKSTDDFSKVENNNVEYGHMNWEQIKEISNSGLVEIQNHSYNLHKISENRYGSGQKENESFEDYEKILSDDLLLLQEKIEKVTERQPTTYTYPYGKYNDNTDKVLKKLGFQASLSVEYGVNMISPNNPDELFGLKRICRSHNQSMSKVLIDGMETLKYRSD